MTYLHRTALTSARAALSLKLLELQRDLSQCRLLQFDLLRELELYGVTAHARTLYHNLLNSEFDLLGECVSDEHLLPMYPELDDPEHWEHLSPDTERMTLLSTQTLPCPPPSE